MAITVLGLFRDRRQAEGAVRALLDAGFRSAELGIVRPRGARLRRFGWAALYGVVGGAIGCGVIGAAIGFGAGGFIPGMHAWLSGGWLVPLILGMTGAGTGAVAGLLMSQTVAERGALFYEDEVQAGRALVSVRAEPGAAELARRILLAEGAFDASPIDAPISKAG